MGVLIVIGKSYRSDAIAADGVTNERGSTGGQRSSNHSTAVATAKVKRKV